MLRGWLPLLLIGCSASKPNDPPEPPRERDVLIEAPDNVVVIFRDGDGDWQLAPHIDNRLGFDIESEFYAVAFVDASRGTVDAVYATLDEERDFKIVAPAAQPPTQPVTGLVTGIDTQLTFGAIVNVGRRRAIVGLDTQMFALDVPEGPHTVGVIKYNNSFLLASALAVRRDVLIAAPLDLAIDLDAEGLPTTKTSIDGPTATCSYTSTIQVGDISLGLGTTTDTKAIVPDPEHWKAQDLFTLELRCRPRNDAYLIQTYQVGSPSELPQRIDAGSTAGSATFDPAEQRFTWSAFDAPVVRGIVAGAPCRSDDLVGFPDQACAQQWRARMTAGWTASTGLEELAVITRAELEGVGAWDDALVLPAPLTWTFEGRVESANTVLRNIRADVLP